MAKSSSSSIERVRKRREKLRQEGKRPLQLWIHSPADLVPEAERQSRLVAAAASEDELAFLDQLADDLGER